MSFGLIIIAVSLTHSLQLRYLTWYLYYSLTYTHLKTALDILNIRNSVALW